MTWHDWVYVVVIASSIADGLYWWRRALRAETAAAKWKAATEHTQRALAARTLLADAQQRTVN